MRRKSPPLEEALQCYLGALNCNVQLAGKLGSKIEVVFERMNQMRKSEQKAKSIAEKERKRADQERDKALMEAGNARKAEANARIEAENARSAEQKAREESERAQMALNKLAAANANVMRLLLTEADRLILKLDYENGLDKIKTAAALGTNLDTVVNAYMEIAFWYGESGNTSRAMGILDSAARLVQDSFALALLRQTSATTKDHRQEILRRVMRQLDETHFMFLLKRYYPDMVSISGATFYTGQESKNFDKYAEGYLSAVSDFKLARVETTLWQFSLFCRAKGLNINQFNKDSWVFAGDRPIIKVTWYQAIEYANWVSLQWGLNPVYEFGPENKKGKTDILIHPKANGYRLPTEMEWEFAARGGIHRSAYLFSGSDTLESVAWYYANSGDHTHAVAGKAPNALGLSDMSGNVAEWCWDWYGSYPNKEAPQNYRGPEGGAERVFRGGSYMDRIKGEVCTVFIRNKSEPGMHYDMVGFRLAQ